MEISQMQSRVEFHTRTTLSLSGPAAQLHFQIGANAQQKIHVTIGNITTGLGSGAGPAGTGLDLRGANRLWAQGANGAATEAEINDVAASVISSHLENIDDALNGVALARARLGAVSNRLDYTMRSLDISSENLSDAESRVRNADMAREMMRFTMSNVLQQASVSMLAQANQLPNNLLQLLR
jgi:flagellin